MKAALYARVSDEEQLKGYSIDAQRRAFVDFCKGRGWIAKHEYIEEGKSARTEDVNKRPMFKQMIADAMAGKFDVLVVHKIDRFSRNLKITLENFEKLSKAQVTFISINEQFDFSQPWGTFAFSMIGAMAQFYSDNLSQETKKGWAERKAQGLYCGLLPFGASKGEDSVPVPHPETYPGLILAFKLAAQGESYREIAQALNLRGYRTAGNMGNRPFSKDTVAGIVKNRFYIGELPNGNGTWIKAKHKPFIEPGLFDAVQEMRHRRNHKKNTINAKANTYSLSTLLRSNICGSSIRMHKNPKGEIRTYCAGRALGFGCHCQGTFLCNYEKQLHNYLNEFVVPQNYQDQILFDQKKVIDTHDNIRNRKKILESKLQRTKELYTWGHISKREYLAEHNSIKNELQLLSYEKDDLSELERVAELLTNVAEAWQCANQEERNKIARIIFEEILVDDKKVAAVKPQPELVPFFKLNYDCHAKSIAGDPDGIRTHDLRRDRPIC